MQFKIRTNIRVALIVLSFLNITKDLAQPMANLISEKAMKPQFDPILKQAEQKQNKVKFGFGLETYVSGNAHGAFYSARVNMSKGKSVFSLGPCLQKRTLELTGAKFGYSYLISEISDHSDEEVLKEKKDKRQDILELRILCYVQYLHNASLSYAASRVETITSNNNGINFNRVRLSTIEAALCAEIDINIKWLKIRTYMGGTTFTIQII